MSCNCQSTPCCCPNWTTTTTTYSCEDGSTCDIVYSTDCVIYNGEEMVFEDCLTISPGDTYTTILQNIISNLAECTTTTTTLPSFTLTSTDFEDFGWGGDVIPDGTNGFTTSATYSAGQELYSPYNFVGAKFTEIQTFFTDNGLLTNSTGYMFNATWGAGSSISSGIALIGFSGFYLYIAPVDTSNNNWQTPGQSNFDIASLAGTFYFPATFTLYSPTTAQGINWC
jgi:hypothetical protein